MVVVFGSVEVVIVVVCFFMRDVVFFDLKIIEKLEYYWKIY